MMRGCGDAVIRNPFAVAVLLLCAACVERPEQNELQVPEPASVADTLAITPSLPVLAVISAADLETALREVVNGPSDAERAAGAQSWFSAETADVLDSVTLDTAGHAIVDFKDLRPLIPNASSSAGSEMLLRELNDALFAFPDVRSAEYRINGSCDVFGEWLQYGCRIEKRPL